LVLPVSKNFPGPAHHDASSSIESYQLVDELRPAKGSALWHMKILLLSGKDTIRCVEEEYTETIYNVWGHAVEKQAKFANLVGLRLASFLGRFVAVKSGPPVAVSLDSLVGWRLRGASGWSVAEARSTARASISPWV
jgi:hypothetical protein